MALDVKVKIDLTKPVGKLGFGTPLILEENAAKEIAYKVVTNVEEVVTAGYEEGTKVYKAAALIFEQTNAPDKIALYATTGTAATALADTQLVSKDWRQLIVVSTGEAATEVGTIIEKVEALDGKMYFAGLDADDSTEITVTGIRRSVLFYCTATEAAPVPVAALVGETAGRDAGSFTYKNMILKGIEPQELSDAQVTAIHEKGGITFLTKAGDNVTSEGKVAGGEYIDIIDSEDYIIQQLAFKSQQVLNAADKIPFDNNGIALLESVAVDVLQTAYNGGMIATATDGTPEYSVSYALRSATTEEDRAKRRYMGGKFSFAMAGAIHESTVTGTITA